MKVETNMAEKNKDISKEKENENKGKTFGDKIVEGRIKKSLSQEAFAEKMGVSRQMVSRWELNTAMPRTPKIKKISEILEIPIEELMSSKFKKDFYDPVATNHFNLKAILKRIAVILIILVLLYFAYVGYKFMVLNGISSKLEQYKNLENYYFKMESQVDGILQETQEIWYKDGRYKIIYESTLNGINSKQTTYVDLNNKYIYMINEEEKSYNQFDLYSVEQYENGKYMYTLFPSMTNSEATDFKEWAFKLNLIFSYYKNGNILLKINNEYIEFNKDNLLPIMQSVVLKENKNIQKNIIKYNIQLDAVKDESVLISSEYKKTN